MTPQKKKPRAQRLILAGIVALFVLLLLLRLVVFVEGHGRHRGRGAGSGPAGASAARIDAAWFPTHFAEKSEMDGARCTFALSQKKGKGLGLKAPQIRAHSGG